MTEPIERSGPAGAVQHGVLFAAACVVLAAALVVLATGTLVVQDAPVSAPPGEGVVDDPRIAAEADTRPPLSACAEGAVAIAADALCVLPSPTAAAADDEPTEAEGAEPTDAVVAEPAPVPSPAQPSPRPAPSPSEVAAPARPAPWTVDVARGYGAWIDVYDWTDAYSKGNPTVTLATLDDLAARGVQTIYIQTARTSRPEDVTEPARLRALVDRAHALGMSVVGWYLPTFVDVETDFRRVAAALELPLDGFALDIESAEVADVAERNRRLVALSERIRALAGTRALIACVLPPVGLEEAAAPDFWPDFPWADLGRLYDVMQPMAYFTYRKPGERGAEWRDAEAYMAENVRRIRERTGRADIPVHVVGGLAAETTVADIEGMTRGAIAEGAIGASLYDVATTGSGLWEPMTAWRDLG